MKIKKILIIFYKKSKYLFFPLLRLSKFFLIFGCCIYNFWGITAVLSQPHKPPSLHLPTWATAPESQTNNNHGDAVPCTIFFLLCSTTAYCYTLCKLPAHSTLRQSDYQSGPSEIAWSYLIRIFPPHAHEEDFKYLFSGRGLLPICCSGMLLVYGLFHGLIRLVNWLSHALGFGLRIFSSSYRSLLELKKS